MDVAKRCPHTRPWPRTPRYQAIARRKVSDLCADERLAARLANELHGAARWWAHH